MTDSVKKDGGLNPASQQICRPVPLQKASFARQLGMAKAAEEAFIPKAIRQFRTALGSRPGAGAPLPFRQIGNPWLGAAIQAGVLGLAGRGLGHLYGKLIGDEDDARRYRAMGTLLGAGGGLALNALPIAGNIANAWRAKDKTPFERFDMLSHAPEAGKTAVASFTKRAYIDNMIKSHQDMYPMGTSGIMTPVGRQDGFGVPISYTSTKLWEDPYLSEQEKYKAISVLEGTHEGRTGVVGWGDIARAGMGAGMGYTGASLFGKVLDGVFGGLEPKTHTRLQQAGMIAGALRATGVLK